MKIRLDDAHLMILIRFPNANHRVGKYLEQVNATIDVVNDFKPKHQTWIDDVLVVQLKEPFDFIRLNDCLEIIEAGLRVA